jgi:hypothetical protein
LGNSRQDWTLCRMLMQRTWTLSRHEDCCQFCQDCPLALL